MWVVGFTSSWYVQRKQNTQTQAEQNLISTIPSTVPVARVTRQTRAKTIQRRAAVQQQPANSPHSSPAARTAPQTLSSSSPPGSVSAPHPPAAPPTPHHRRRRRQRQRHGRRQRSESHATASPAESTRNALNIQRPLRAVDEGRTGGGKDIEEEGFCYLDPAAHLPVIIRRQPHRVAVGDLNEDSEREVALPFLLLLGGRGLRALDVERARDELHRAPQLLVALHTASSCRSDDAAEGAERGGRVGVG
eukprot:COSAG05_NODE_5272_length_1218_cov_0.874888_1_plen_248_part_00